MANASIWCLTVVSKKSDAFDFTIYRIEKESHTFQQRKPLILQHDADTDVSLTYLSSFFNKSTHSFVVLINYFKKLGAFHRNL